VRSTLALLVIPRAADWRMAAALGVSALLFAAVAVRVFAIDRLPGINGDEARYGAQVMALKSGQWPDLRSGTGLPPNPFYTGPLYLIHCVAPGPSFLLLRSVSLLSGVLAVGLSYPLLAGTIGRRAAGVAVLLLASSPVLIAYSRFGWDQSQAPLAGLVCLALVLRRRWRLAALAFLAALVVHPTNVFLAPVLLGPALVETCVALRRLPPPRRRRLITLGGCAVATLAALAAVTLVAMIPVATMRATFPRGPDEVVRRATDPAGWWQFAIAVADLLTGPTIYQYIVGLPGAIPWHRAVALIVALAAAAGWRGWYRVDHGQALGLTGGLLVSLAAFYPIAGLHAIRPGWERYAMFLVVPSLIVVARAIAGLEIGRLAAAGQFVFTMAVSAFLLANVWRWYYLPQWKTGGQSELTFRTGPVEPKRAAFELIAAAAPDEPITILAEDWWCYNPLLYLAAGRPNIEVWPLASAPAVPTGRRCFIVGFHGGLCDQWFAQLGQDVAAQPVFDYGSRPVLHVRDLSHDPSLVGLLSAAAAKAVK